MNPHYHSRRSFLVAGGLSYFGLDLASRAAAAPSEPSRRTVAKSTIMIWLSGGASHIDTWDMKPDATVFHAMGIDDLSATNRDGRPMQLMEEGRALTELF